MPDIMAKNSNPSMTAIRIDSFLSLGMRNINKLKGEIKMINNRSFLIRALRFKARMVNADKCILAK